MKYQLNQTVIGVATAMLVLLSGQLHANSVPVLEVQDQVVKLGGKLSLLVAPTDIDGVEPSVFVRSGPDGGRLSDNGDGTRTFSWRPSKKGDYTVNFIVQDGANASLAKQYAYRIKVVGNVAANATASEAIKAMGTPVGITGSVAVSTAIESMGSAVAVRDNSAAAEPAIKPVVIASVEPTVAAAVEPVVEPTVTAAVVPIVSNAAEPTVTAAAAPVAVAKPTAVTAPVKPADTAVVAATDNAVVQPDNSTNEESVPKPSPISSDQSIFLNGEVGSVTKILTDLPVSETQTSVQHTPIDSSGRYLYTANVEPGANGDGKGVALRTVLRQGYQRSDNSWEWTNVIVEDRTLYDPWHSPPSVAVDKTGQIHVAYNMHNFPWQYKRSDRAHDITSLVFKGQEITDAQLKLAAEQNRTNFPTLGTAEIHGNQITYPAFQKDKNNDLFVSYRFAAAPKRKFSERTMSTGIAKYDTGSRAWSSIGAKHNPSDGDFDRDAASPDAAITFAGKKGWTSYIPKVAFSKQNNMIVGLFWRSGIAGQQVTMPCVVRSISNNDVVDMKGGSVSLPIQPEQCGNIGIDNNKEFYSIASFAIDNEDNPYFLMSPINGDRFIARYSAAQQRWVQEKSPEAATEIFFDNDNNLYAIASGLKIFKRTSVDTDWETIYSENAVNNCFPKVKLDAAGKNAFIHAQSCDDKHITVYGLRLP